MIRKMLAWTALALFCMCGVIISISAVERLGVLASIGLMLLFVAGFFICMECLGKATWKEDKKEK